MDKPGPQSHDKVIQGEGLSAWIILPNKDQLLRLPIVDQALEPRHASELVDFRMDSPVVVPRFDACNLLLSNK
jgi:hypothetical protein